STVCLIFPLKVVIVTRQTRPQNKFSDTSIIQGAYSTIMRGKPKSGRSWKTVRKQRHGHHPTYEIKRDEPTFYGPAKFNEWPLQSGSYFQTGKMQDFYILIHCLHSESI
ncbi:hypothetical protein P879_02529, partial [Paragonimus westermani]